jgi:signal transduction histidine kinase
MILAFDRRYVFFPVMLAIAFVLGAYVVSEIGQNRVRESTRQAAVAQSRLRALGTVLRLTTDAETATRGYLLTNDPAYLSPLRSAEEGMDAALADLRDKYPRELTPAQVEWMAQLRTLVASKLTAMRITVALQEEQGQAAAMNLVRTDIERKTMDAIRETIRAEQVAEGRELRRISTGSERDLAVTRTIMAGGTLLNIALVAIAGILITRETRRRLAEGRQLEARKRELEHEVAARVQELSTLSSYLQEVSEREKAALARELHDELGGLLVAAKMDISALRRKFADSESPELRSRWERVLGSLDSGVNLKRRVVDQLHPSLLDTMGLYAAIRWQFEEACNRGGIHCVETLPDHELPLSKDAAISIFRVAQESTANILTHGEPKSAELRIDVESDEMVMRIRDDGEARNGVALRPPSGLASTRHRVSALGGSWQVRSGPDGLGTEVEVRLPLSRIQVAPA